MKDAELMLKFLKMTAAEDATTTTEVLAAEDQVAKEVSAEEVLVDLDQKEREAADLEQSAKVALEAKDLMIDRLKVVLEEEVLLQKEKAFQTEMHEAKAQKELRDVRKVSVTIQNQEDQEKARFFS